MVADAIDVVILHEEYHRNSRIREDLSVGVEYGAAHVARQANLAAQPGMTCDVRDRDAVLAAAARSAMASRRPVVPLLGVGVPDRVGQVRLVGQPDRLPAQSRRDLELVSVSVAVVSNHVEDVNAFDLDL